MRLSARRWKEGSQVGTPARRFFHWCSIAFARRMAIKVSVPDLMISDIGMPEQDGYELMSRVRSLPAEEGGKVPAIALTAYARVEDRMHALRAGYQMHVPKPVELAELVTVAASLVRRGG